MSHTPPINLKERIIAALTVPSSELWFPQLTYDLTQMELQKLYEETGITEEDYGTARVILNDTYTERVFEETIFMHGSSEEIKNKTVVEMLPPSIIEQYKELGVDFYTREELRINTEIADCLKDAFKVIRHVLSLFTTVRYLVKSIHIIKPEDDEYDVSFSESHIPFSIFVSIPQKNNTINALRTAEAIIHEAMHLQLTLIESMVSLVYSSRENFYSPWKEELRSPQGILHALYVFRVIDCFFSELSNVLLKSTVAASHGGMRRKEIDSQIKMTKDFAESGELTALGKVFACRLIKKIN